METQRYTADKIRDIEHPPGNGEVHPDLIFYKGHFYCQIQEGGGNRIVRSREGGDWETVQLGRVGFMFSITPRDELMMISTWCRQPPQKPDGNWHWQSYTTFSTDGVKWTFPCIIPEGFETCMFRVDWHDGLGYSVGYGHKDVAGTLYRTDDGRDWQVLKPQFFPPGRGGNEASLAFEPDGRAYCLLRGDRKTPLTFGYGQAPDCQTWDWKVPEIDWYRDGNAVSADQAIRAPFGAPKFLRLSDGRLLAYGRVLGPDKGPIGLKATQKVAGGDSHDPQSCFEHASVTLFEVDPARARLTRLADFPGYSHYHGIVEHDGSLWIACGRADSITEAWMLTVPLHNLPFPCAHRD